MRTADDYAKCRIAHGDCMAIWQIARTFHLSRRTGLSRVQAVHAHQAGPGPRARLLSRTRTLFPALAAGHGPR